MSSVRCAVHRRGAAAVGRVRRNCIRRKKRTSAADLRAAIERGHHEAAKRMIAGDRRLVHGASGPAADHPVHVAARSGHRRIVGLLLRRGADPNARNADSMTPAHLSVTHRHHRVVGLLMDRGADPAAVDGFDNTPLDLATLTNEKQCLDVLLNRYMPDTVMNKAFYKAAMQNNRILMNKLLNRGADIDHVDESTGCTALLVAIKSKHDKTVQFLLEKGADPTVNDPSGWTCLHLVVHHQHPPQTLLLIMSECGEALGRLIDRRTRHRETALHLAAKRGDDWAAVSLLRAGAHADALDRMCRTPLSIALRRRNTGVAVALVRFGASVDRVPGTRRAPLHVAVAQQDLQMVRMLLDRGSVAVDVSDDDLDRTVVHVACESGDADVLACLLAHVEPDALFALHARGRANPPIVAAAAMGHRAAVDALLARGVDVNARRADGETALHAAARANHAALADRLLDAGARVDAAAGRRPLDVAVRTWGREATVTALLVHADRLLKATARGDVDAVAFLIACGVSPNATTAAHGSPLHAAVRHRQYRMAAVLLSSDRCRTAVRHRGATALDYAVAMGDARAARMILWRRRRRRRRARSASGGGTTGRTARDARERPRRTSV